MKPSYHFVFCFIAVLCSRTSLCAQEPSSEILALQHAAEDFIIAYNGKDAAKIATLFTENGEVSDLDGKEVVSGRSAIQANYEAIFAQENVASIAIEVDSVRLVGDNLAIEDGTLHFTSPGENFAARSTTYTAVLQKTPAGTWQIASTRSLRDATSAAGHLADLAASLKGDWTGQRDGLRLDLAFGWDDTGNFITGEMLATRADSEPLTTTYRFGWDAGGKIITCWIHDSAGGNAKADWTPTETGWLIHTQGTTAEGETMSANQTLTFEDDDTFYWTGKDRLINGEIQPEVQLRIVRQAPEPQAAVEAE